MTPAPISGRMVLDALLILGQCISLALLIGIFMARNGMTEAQARRRIYVMGIFAVIGVGAAAVLVFFLGSIFTRILFWSNSVVF